MKIARLGFIAAFVVASAIAPAAFAGKNDNSIRFGTDYVLDSIDFYFNDTLVNARVAALIWDTLIYRDPNTGEYRGQLATAWKQIDEKTLELELRKGVTFHNGAEFGADDVVYTLNFVSKPENKSVRQVFVSWIDRAEKIDKYKVRIVTKRPFPPAIAYLAAAIFIYPHEHYSKVGAAGMNRQAVGSGPFRVVEHAPGKHVRMERNPDYFKDSPRPQPKVDKFEIRFIPDQQTQIAELLTGGLDMIFNVPRDQAEQLRTVARLQVVPSETTRVAFLHLNGSEKTPAPELRDIRVRKAILHAIDREAMVKSMVGEGARMLHTLCHPSQFGCADEGAPHYGYDPGRAKQLLAEASFPNGFNLDLYAYRDRLHTEAMIGYLHAVGIKANLRFVQIPAMREAVRGGKVAMNHYTWVTSVADISAFTSAFFGSNPDNMNGDSEIRDLFDRGDTSLDPNVRRQAYAKALALIQERAYALPLFSLPNYFVAAKELEFKVYPDESLRFWEMSWK